MIDCPPIAPCLSEISIIEELVKTGAKIIVTQCPGCIMQLKDGLKALKVDNVEVLDLAEVVARAMEV